MNVAAPGSEATGNLSENIEQYRVILENQQRSFESERAAFGEERKLWKKERAMMQQRIRELEQQIGMPADQGWVSLPPRSAVHDLSGSAPNPTALSAFDSQHSGTKPASFDCSSFLNPQGLGNRTQEQVKLADHAVDKVTSDASGLRIGDADKNCLVSPKGTSIVQPITIHDASERHSQPLSSSDPENGDSGNDNLMPASDSGSASSNQTPVNALCTEAPLAPHHTRTTFETEYSNSPPLDEDPALQGPLTLQNDKALDDDFLQTLDQKLSDEAQQATSNGSGAASEEYVDGDYEPIPGVRFKKTAMNFGTRYGTTDVGIR